MTDEFAAVSGVRVRQTLDRGEHKWTEDKGPGYRVMPVVLREW